MSAKERDEKLMREHDVDAAILKLEEWLLGRREMDNLDATVAVTRL